ncbi:MAG: phosphopentomutase [Paenibacillus sp. RIFOXYA1_FULL_44_5]|nr:MAG: phosphopentomutase [Paenibacillus sp. RIFOXYA1_FULL_44_5]
MRFERVCLIVLDSVGIGELPDAEKFGDQGAHTLGHIAEAVSGFTLPYLRELGLGNIESLRRIAAADHPRAYYGKMAEISDGKDTMTGHWEIMGLQVMQPFRTYPGGFPQELIAAFEQQTGRAVIGNKVASGTDIIVELGTEQMKSGAWIVYTSADSVLQIAAHEDIIPLDELYRGCEIAHELTLDPRFSVGRVIARPYAGEPGHFIRTSNRHDYAVSPPQKTVMNYLQEAGFDCIAIGKINDIYSGEGVTKSAHTKSNEDGINQTIEALRGYFRGLVFTNLVDFDSLYGHRRNPKGYGEALEYFDSRLPDIMKELKDNDLLIITADHGNDPTHSGTDHTREYVPLLVWSPSFTHSSSLGIRSTFADVGATIADNFQIKRPEHGTSFLQHLI